ncbi:poly [ADP-ribose] polymerase 1 [Leucoraja erinacea]|uniref:poly [ADP-ribose] polymerase 1 n=1 Tax=Leucoraja erinaceus TaxID=7782 RepID=UPI0024579985|nr:poly [ADP-ribose] polymerase 1 [Leucoraja erinacea]
MAEDKLFKAEYAKSGRASCKKCGESIAKDSLRLAIMVQSPMFDGKVPHWHHYSCFWKRTRVGAPGEVDGLSDLRWEDQEKIRKSVETGGGGAGGKGGEAGEKTLADFAVEYAKSNRSTCKGCGAKIEKDKVRLSKKMMDPEKPQLGMIDRWYHPDCFVFRRAELAFLPTHSATQLRGFSSLSADDKATLKKDLPAIKTEGKRKGDEADGETTGKKKKKKDEKLAKQEKELKEQSQLIWGIKDSLKKSCSTNDLRELLIANGQEIPSGESAIVDRVSDGMAFGALQPCGQCQGQMVLKDDAYTCTGNITAWTKCSFTTQSPQCKDWITPKEFHCVAYLKKFKFKRQGRIFPPEPPAADCRPGDTDTPSAAAGPPLTNLKVLLVGKLSKNKEELKSLVEEMGGKTTTSANKAQLCVSSQKEVDKMSKKMEEVKAASVRVVSEDFLLDLRSGKGLPDLLSAHAISPWGAEVSKPPAAAAAAKSAGNKAAKNASSKVKQEEGSGKSEKKMKLTVKGGGAVDPDSGKWANPGPGSGLWGRGVTARRWGKAIWPFAFMLAKDRRDAASPLQRPRFDPDLGCCPCGVCGYSSGWGLSDFKRGETPDMSTGPSLIFRHPWVQSLVGLPVAAPERSLMVREQSGREPGYRPTKPAPGGPQFQRPGCRVECSIRRWTAEVPMRLRSAVRTTQAPRFRDFNALSYWVFRSWGRVGTTIGGNKVEKMSSREHAVDHFLGLYEEKTGNAWQSSNFTKYPNKFYPLETDYGQDEEAVKKLTASSGTRSKLEKAVQELIRAIFDVESMKKAMVEFQIDLQKMPLGKLSKRQIQSAYSILNEVQQVVASAGPDSHILDLSNRFYTLIPHDFGMKKPPLLNNEAYIQAKAQLLGSLLDIEVAYSLLTGGLDDEAQDPIDSNYEKLHTDLQVVDKHTDEAKIITDYVKNTHAATHNQYHLEVLEIFRVRRESEEQRFQPFSELHNRQLLWHGSRTTNFAGILSQGLRIAPPEAPVTGYMFGKGVYFADMVSKSANYCHTSQAEPVGLVLLADVALGNMHELKRASHVTKLPKGKHSVKGVGKTAPDPSATIKLDGVEVPLGKGMQTPAADSSLLYNEYIVYDVAQVNIKYLLRLNFKYKTSLW